MQLAFYASLTIIAAVLVAGAAIYLVNKLNER
jgi:hypothetical protein